MLQSGIIINCSKPVSLFLLLEFHNGLTIYFASRFTQVIFQRFLNFWGHWKLFLQRRNEQIQVTALQINTTSWELKFDKHDCSFLLLIVIVCKLLFILLLGSKIKLYCTSSSYHKIIQCTSAKFFLPNL